jgi:hypothetical protein
MTILVTHQIAILLHGQWRHWKNISFMPFLTINYKVKRILLVEKIISDYDIN